MGKLRWERLSQLGARLVAEGPPLFVSTQTPENLTLFHDPMCVSPRWFIPPSATSSWEEDFVSWW